MSLKRKNLGIQKGKKVMRFKDKRIEKKMEAHADMNFNPKLSRRKNRKLRKQKEG